MWELKNVFNVLLNHYAWYWYSHPTEKELEYILHSGKIISQFSWPGHLSFFGHRVCLKCKGLPKLTSFGNPLTDDNSCPWLTLFSILAHTYLLVKLSWEKWINPEFSLVDIFRYNPYLLVHHIHRDSQGIMWQVATKSKQSFLINNLKRNHSKFFTSSLLK